MQVPGATLSFPWTFSKKLPRDSDAQFVLELLDHVRTGLNTEPLHPESPTTKTAGIFVLFTALSSNIEIGTQLGLTKYLMNQLMNWKFDNKEGIQSTNIQ